MRKLAKPKGKTRGKKGRGRGGLRSPAGGRPREPRGPGGIKWVQVRRAARLGADRDTIVLALGITDEQLRKPEVLRMLQAEIARGNAQHQLAALADCARVRKGGDGSVNAILGTLKHSLGWNRHDAAKSRTKSRPDMEAGLAELDQVLKRCREARREAR